jgi:hypothetical protein
VYGIVVVGIGVASVFSFYEVASVSVSTEFRKYLTISDLMVKGYYMHLEGSTVPGGRKSMFLIIAAAWLISWTASASRYITAECAKRAEDGRIRVLTAKVFISTVNLCLAAIVIFQFACVVFTAGMFLVSVPTAGSPLVAFSLASDLIYSVWKNAGEREFNYIVVAGLVSAAVCSMFEVAKEAVCLWATRSIIKFTQPQANGDVKVLVKLLYDAVPLNDEQALKCKVQGEVGRCASPSSRVQWQYVLSLTQNGSVGHLGSAAGVVCDRRYVKTVITEGVAGRCDRTEQSTYCPNRECPCRELVLQFSEAARCVYVAERVGSALERQGDGTYLLRGCGETGCYGRRRPIMLEHNSGMST